VSICNIVDVLGAGEATGVFVQVASEPLNSAWHHDEDLSSSKLTAGESCPSPLRRLWFCSMPATVRSQWVPHDGRVPFACGTGDITTASWLYFRLSVQTIEDPAFVLALHVKSAGRMKRSANWPMKLTKNFGQVVALLPRPRNFRVSMRILAKYFPKYCPK
jgi:hypothetical protein